MGRKTVPTKVPFKLKPEGKKLIQAKLQRHEEERVAVCANALTG